MIRQPQRASSAIVRSSAAGSTARVPARTTSTSSWNLRASTACTRQPRAGVTIARTYRELDAPVGGEPDDGELGDAAREEQARERAELDVVVHRERGVAVDERVRALRGARSARVHTAAGCARAFWMMCAFSPMPSLSRRAWMPSSISQPCDCQNTKQVGRCGGRVPWCLGRRGRARASARWCRCRPCAPRRPGARPGRP
jgi:hypothetical protein